jgi:hypothetical protein
MNTVVAHIDISRPSGRKIVREISKKRAVTIEYPFPQEKANEKWHKHEDVWADIELKFNQHYGTNYKL